MFTITASKQKASSDSPFADISKRSQFSGEEEILFVPGQMFYIDKIDMRLEEEIKVYSIEMSLQDKCQERIEPLHQTFQIMLEKHANDSLLCLAAFLVTSGKVSDGKDLNKEFLRKMGDRNKQYDCYEGLFLITNSENDTEEAEFMYRKMNEKKFGLQQLPTTESVRITTEDECNDFHTAANLLSNVYSQLSVDQSADEILEYANSNRYRNNLEQTAHATYTIVQTLLESGLYPMAILFLEQIVYIMKIQTNVSFDPLLKVRCFIQLGHCYRQLNDNINALEKYRLVFEQDVRLPTNEYITTLNNYGMMLEDANKYEDALYQYIKIAEIYNSDANIGSLRECQHTEERIRRVVSRLIPME
ncbi:unnamed protein product [Adineta ricciae]|uniref:Uncharacterized protein n=1 Tax=Adineta ricciae TaxID=249248 RepID=A0A816DWN3_ADIRI|nr:unnamed protein product [Adineta ricciae]